MTDNITLPRATVEQALEALEWSWGGEPMGTLERDAITALRAALAQQAKPVEPAAEARYDGTLRWLEPHGVGLHRIQGPLYTAPPQQAEPVDTDCHTQGICQRSGYGITKP